MQVIISGNYSGHRFGMAENVLADAALRRASGTSPGALGALAPWKRPLEFHWILSEFNCILCKDIYWILLEIQ